jgi:putative ABC transport system substrate-binding protein
MRRREVTILIAGAGLMLPFAARSQQPSPVIGFLSGHAPGALGKPRLAAFQQGLAEEGFVVGKSVAIEARWAEGHNDRLPAMAAELARLRVRVIATDTTPAVLAAKAATTTIPIVFALSIDPVAAGLVANLARPGGNLTGATRLNLELAPKGLQLLKEMVPTATSMALLVNPTNPLVAESERRQLKATAGTLGLDLHVFEASDERDIDAAFVAAARVASGLVVSADAFFGSRHIQLGALTLRHRLPTIHVYREFVAAGGLMGYSGGYTDANRIAGVYAGRILKGEKPAELPVQQVTKIELFINLATAKALGITVPPSILLHATEVIE